MSICYIDLVDACQLKWPSCVRGTRLLDNSPKTMEVGFFEEIVKKVKSEGYDFIALFNWAEPFLNQNIADFVDTV